MRQQSLTESMGKHQVYFSSHPMAQKLAGHLVKLLVLQSLPFNVVDSQPFRDFVACVHPRWMDGSDSEIHLHQKEFSARDFYDTYLSASSHPTLLDEFIYFPMRQLYKEMSAGHIQGRTLLQFNPSPAPYKLLVCCEFFEEINVLELTDECSLALRKWLKKDPEALDWTHMSQYASSLEGRSDGWIKKEEILRERFKRVIDCDIAADPLVAPGTLPPVDCLITTCGFEVISKDHEEFRNNLRKTAALLKVGGYLAIFVLINAKFYKVGEPLFHVLCFNEDFLRAALMDSGYVIESLESRPRVDYGGYMIFDSLVYVRARKVREV
ncbi:indolethylamine N-methyltransferase-like [Dendropsophus ebraccatus]|uniref:indolethylamine N-methyltransferase-like n=1 Tax=Dendropsophus ebraccatus TaxID=150705 RepID=UPI0038312CE3